MIISFRDSGTEAVYNGLNSSAGRKTLPAGLWKVAHRKFFFLENASRLDDLKMPPGNRLEALKGGRKGQYSIRINQQYRICFEWTEKGPGNVKITDYHS
jgi:proteic killer suppression protein